MSSSHSPDDEDPETTTPRGGFMARPGLKMPPRHAVVVRGGDAPESEDIPVARSSFPPPPPASVPAPPSASEKITLRAIPTPSSPPGCAPPLASVPPVVESLPPPSDAAVVANVRARASSVAGRRARGSRWTIVAAAAAGLLLGFASVAARLRAAAITAQPQPVEEGPRLLKSTGAVSSAVHVSASASAGANPQAAPTPIPANDRQQTEPKPSRPASPATKRSIF